MSVGRMLPERGPHTAQRQWRPPKSFSLAEKPMVSPADFCHYLVDGFEDAFFDVVRVGSGKAVVGHRIDWLIAAFVKHPDRRDIRHHVIAVARGDQWFAGKLL